MKHRLLTLIFIFWGLLTHAQTEWPAGGVASGMGGVSSITSDAWSVFNNPGTLGGIKHHIISFYSENRFLMAGLNRGQFSVALPTKQGTISLGFSHFGNNVFNRQQLALGFGRALGRTLQVGIGLHYIQTRMGLFGNLPSVGASIGISYPVTPQVQIGVHIFNPNQSRIGPGKEERHPTYFRSGFQWKINSQLKLAAETDFILKNGMTWKVGSEYKISKEFFWRAGINYRPFSFTLGAAFHIKNIQLDISTGYFPILGMVPGFGGTALFPISDEKKSPQILPQSSPEK